MKILNKELRDLDIYDADDMEVFENALNDLGETAKELQELELSNAESIRHQCRAIFDFFNNVFGEGTDYELFGNKTNLRICTEALTEVINTVNAKSKKDSSKVNSYVERLKK